MKYLGSYENLAAYKAANVTPPNVSLIEGQCYYKPIKQTWFGDIAYYDKKKEEFDFCSCAAYTESVYKDLTKVPVGVVAVPARYTPDNTIRVMSLKNMSCKTPETGSGATLGTKNEAQNSDEDICMRWGASNAVTRVDNTTLPNLSSVIYVNPITGEGLLNGNSYRTTDWMRIPSTTGFSGYEGQYPGTHYYYGASSGADAWVDPNPGEAASNTRFGPFPLLANGDKNPLYFAEGMATNDFDGRGNTDAILNTASKISTAWKTAATIEWGTTSTGYYPAAFCCDRYHTIGTSAGDWYLPAEGELAFVTAFYKELEASTLAVENALGSSYGIRIGRSNETYGSWLWSSSLHDSSYARYVYLNYGYVHYTTRSNVSTNNRVRAFLAL